jgi:hypothetical protein
MNDISSLLLEDGAGTGAAEASPAEATGAVQNAPPVNDAYAPIRSSNYRPSNLTTIDTPEAKKASLQKWSQNTADADPPSDPAPTPQKPENSSGDLSSYYDPTLLGHQETSTLNDFSNTQYHLSNMEGIEPKFMIRKVNVSTIQ